jgi:hypothetical protein
MKESTRGRLGLLGGKGPMLEPHVEHASCTPGARNRANNLIFVTKSEQARPWPSSALPRIFFPAPTAVPSVGCGKPVFRTV